MKKPIRVLHVFGQLNRGGAETMIMNIYRRIPKDIIQFDFITHIEDNNDFEEEIISMGGSVYYIPYYRGYNHLEYVRAWKKFITHNDETQIIHGHFRTTGFIYLSLAKKYGLTTIAHSHSTSEEKGIKGSIITLFNKIIKYYSDYNLACSNEAGYWLFGKDGNKKHGFTIFKNAIEIDKYKFNEDTRNKIRDELHLNDKYVVGHVGNFRSAKNHEFIIEVFKKYHNIYNKDAMLLLIGEGELMHSIKKKISDYEIDDQVILIGNVNNVEEYLQVFDVFLFPSIYEGLGMALIEAQASGLPSIVSINIPSEAIICNSTIPLEFNVDLWCNQLKEFQSFNRNNNQYSLVYKAGYDVNYTSNYLKEFYLSIHNEAN